MTKVFIDNEEIDLIDEIDPCVKEYDYAEIDDLENTIEFPTIKEDSNE